MHGNYFGLHQLLSELSFFCGPYLLLYIHLCVLFSTGQL